MYGPDAVILLMYGSHDMRHTSFSRLTVINGIPGFGVSHLSLGGGGGGESMFYIQIYP